MTDTFKCFEVNCGGIVRKATITHKVKLSNGDTIKIDNLVVERCNRCGEILFDADACARVDSAILEKYPNYGQRKRKR